MNGDNDSSKVVGITEPRRPPNAGKGRVKGVPNKVTKTVKEALEESFTRLGGVEWLMALAASDPATYARLLIKLLPTKIDAEVSGTPIITGSAQPTATMAEIRQLLQEERDGQSLA